VVKILQVFQNICTDHTIETVRDKWQITFLKVNKDIGIGSRVKINTGTFVKVGT